VHPLEFLIYALLGVVGGLVSVTFVKLLLWLRQRFREMPKSTEWLQPTAGGLLVGVLGWFVPQVLGVGYGNVSLALNGKIALGTMALLVILKIAATATCYASGNAGGIFGPALFIGAMTGGAIGGAAHFLLPDLTGGVGAYALVGMGAAFAGIIRVPLTSVIMIFEVTRDYSIIVPLMIANLISYYISSRLQKEPIYEALQHQDGVRLPSGARDRQEIALVADGIRPVSKVLAAADTVAAAIASTGGVTGTWVVAAPAGALGIVTTDQLLQAARDGREHTTLADLVVAPSPSEPYPYVYRDEPLDTALRRMADAGVETLPVVSRTDLHNIVGMISLQDALAAYGFGVPRTHAAAPPPGEFKAPAAKLGIVVAAIAAMLLLAVSLGYFYRVERASSARKYLQTGNELVANGRFSEAVEPYRHALSISPSDEHRLALALALVHAQRLDEARIYLREVLRDQPTSGPANLGLAEVDAASGDIDEASTSYHRALYGVWPASPLEHRVETRMELIGELGKAGRNKQAQAELLSLIAEMPADPAIRKRVAQMLLSFGLPKESADVFREVTQAAKNDADAYLGLADAEAAQWKYMLACSALRHASRLEPGDAAIVQRLNSCEQILALDPSSAGLPVAARFDRSRTLLERVLAAWTECATAHPADPPSPNASALLDRARKSLALRRKPPSYADASDENISLATQLWSLRPAPCRSPENSPLDKVMAHLSQ
jgi:Flp pilus assembly protein TadD/CBS domain-containing protein